MNFITSFVILFSFFKLENYKTYESLSENLQKGFKYLVNDFTLETIEDYLFQFRQFMSEPDYNILSNALYQYFKTGLFPKISKQIQTKGKLNKKRFGWALNELFAAKSKGIEKELLLFAKLD